MLGIFNAVLKKTSYTVHRHNWRFCHFELREKSVVYSIKIPQDPSYRRDSSFQKSSVYDGAKYSLIGLKTSFPS
jgi:hypothetical protein